MFYLLSKELSKVKAIKILEKIRTLFKVAKVDDKVIDLSLVSNFRDFEDAIQYYSAIINNIDLIITRNKKDFQTAEISVYTPEEFISIYIK